MYFANIQLLRGVAALAVLLSHIIMFGNQKYQLAYPSLNDWVDYLAGGVDLFFVISGFIIYATTVRDRCAPKRIPATLHFLYRRFGRIYPVYWVISLCLVGVYFYAPYLINSGAGNEVSLLHSFLLLPHETVPLLMVAWTLEYEMMFYIIFAFLMLLGGQFVLPGIIIWAVLGTLIGNMLPETSALMQLLTSPLIIEFMLGCVIAWGWQKIKYRKFILYSLSFLVVGFLVMFSPYFSINEPSSRVLYLALPCTAVVFLAVYLEKHKDLKSGRIGEFFGNISYGLYLIHVPVISAVGRLWYLLGFDKYLPVEVMAFLMGLGSIIAAYVLYKVVEVPSHQFLRQLSSKYFSRN